MKIFHKLPWHTIFSYISPGSSVNLAETKDDIISNKWNEVSREKRSENEVDKEDIQGNQVAGTMEVSSPNPNIETLPVCNLYDVDYSSGSEMVLIVGNETHGLSKAAYRLAAEKQGRRIYLPMKTGVDSLNAAMAGTAILFEMKRQLYEQQKT